MVLENSGRAPHKGGTKRPNPRGLFDTVRTEEISMCGYGAAVAMLTAMRELGATHAELLRYATSGEVNGDMSEVVGYAGIVIR